MELSVLLESIDGIINTVGEHNYNNIVTVRNRNRTIRSAIPQLGVRANTDQRLDAPINNLADTVIKPPNKRKILNSGVVDMADAHNVNNSPINYAKKVCWWQQYCEPSDDIDINSNVQRQKPSSLIQQLNADNDKLYLSDYQSDSSSYSSLSPSSSVSSLSSASSTSSIHQNNVRENGDNVAHDNN